MIAQPKPGECRECRECGVNGTHGWTEIDLCSTCSGESGVLYKPSVFDTRKTQASLDVVSNGRCYFGCAVGEPHRDGCNYSADYKINLSAFTACSEADLVERSRRYLDRPRLADETYGWPGEAPTMKTLEVERSPMCGCGRHRVLGGDAHESHRIALIVEGVEDLWKLRGTEMVKVGIQPDPEFSLAVDDPTGDDVARDAFRTTGGKTLDDILADCSRPRITFKVTR